MAQRTNLKPITEIKELKGMGGCPVFAVCMDYRRCMWIDTFTLHGKPHKDNYIHDWEIRVRWRGQVSRIFLGDHGIGKRNNFHAIFPYSTETLAEAMKLVNAQNFEAYVQRIWHTLDDSLEDRAQLSYEQVQEEADVLDKEDNEIMEMQDGFLESDLGELCRNMEDLYDDLDEYEE